MSHDNDAGRDSPAAQESLVYSSIRQKLNRLSDRDSQAQNRQHLNQERFSEPIPRSWRKLKNVIVATSLPKRRKSKNPCEDNDAFLDYFSTQRRPSIPSYYQHQSGNTRLYRSNQNSHHQDGFCFVGFNKLPEPHSLIETNTKAQEKITLPLFNLPTQSEGNCTIHVENAHNNSLQCVSGITDTQPFDASMQSYPTQPVELEADSDSKPQFSTPSFKTQFIHSLRNLNFCLPKRTLLLNSNGSRGANPLEGKSHIQCPQSTCLIFNPQSTFMFIWLGIVAMATVYNFWTAIMRQAFQEVQKDKAALWISLDGIADLIYLADIMVQLRTSYLEKGLVVKSSRKIATRYLWSRAFALDTLSLLPLDLLQSITGIQPLLRFPRFLKCFRAWLWKVMVENRTTFPNSWRVLTLIHILFLGCHWFASIYYILSESTRFRDSWGYPSPTTQELQSLLRKYLQSFYWATVTLTTIGDIAEPEATFQFAFTIATYLIGVFVFATIVGQVGAIINSRNAARLSFEHLLDNAKSYMSTHRIPQRLRNRVLRWYGYAWERRRLFGENELNCLGHLPENLKTELALHVHLETLKKVTIFRECRPEFLHDLVLKMRPYIFTPGDLICRKGEVAKEMFIIADGVLEVIGKAGMVLKRLEAGDFFGEIGILCVNGSSNKRTADVRAVGYAELFLLSREDVLSALADHPDAHAVIMERATQRLQESQRQEHAQGILGRSPSLLHISENAGDESESILMQLEPHGSAMTDLGELTLLGPNRPSEDTSATVPVATTSIGHRQTFAHQKDNLLKRGKEALDSFAELNQFVEELMFFLNRCSERIAVKDKKIKELTVESILIKRELKRMNEKYAESPKNWNLEKML